MIKVIKEWTEKKKSWFRNATIHTEALCEDTENNSQIKRKC